MGHEESIQDGCLCWRENDKSPWIRYTPQELTKKIDEFYSTNKHLRTRITELERELENLDARTNVKPNNPCPACSGYGLKTYGDTTTWMHGIGGQMMTEDVCDTCWGSGTTDRTGTDLRKVKAHITELERERNKHQAGSSWAHGELARVNAENERLKAELAVRDRAMEMLDARVVRVYECFDKCPKHMNETCDCTATALSQARLELDGKARITSLLSGRQQSEPSPDADLIAPNSIDDAPPDQIIG